MARGSFFVQTPENALRHVNVLAKGLKKIAVAGWVGGTGCAVLAVFLSRFLVPPHARGNTLPGFQEMSGISLVTWFMALAMLLFSSLYFISGWGLSHQKPWARYTAAGTFVLKVILCVWLGRGSFAAMIVFLLVAGWDIYGLWVLLARETGHLFGSTPISEASVKPANLVT
jgi:hypothetical protein